MNSLKKWLTAALTAALTLPALSLPAAALSVDGHVVDTKTDTPIAGAFVTLGDTSVRTDKSGAFHIEGDGTELRARAYGHKRTEQTLTAAAKGPVTLQLEPFTTRGVYLSGYGVSSHVMRDRVLQLIKDTQVNTLVIDIKTDRSLVSFKTSLPLANEIGAQKIVLKRDMPALIAKLHSRGIYAIARIVTFKDTLLAQAHPDLAIKTPDGKIWKDNEGLSWVDPFKQEARDYNVALAVEAAKMGFDEIQFDYVRFPDTRGLVFSKPNTEANRVAAIDSLLAEARRKLKPYNVFLSADVFGYVCWNHNDTDIGQRIADVLKYVDYISPMLYPSTFQFGIPGFRDPVKAPRQIIYRSLVNARERTGVNPIRFRPWLQAFRDYAFDHRHFGEEEIQQQIAAADKFGSDGWMLWNPRNVYVADNIKPTPPVTTAENETRTETVAVENEQAHAIH